MAQEQSRRDRPRDPEGGEQAGHRREVGGAQGAAPGRQEGRHAGDRGLDARDHAERSLLQQGHGEPGVPVRQAGRERDRGPEGVLRLLALARVELRDAPLDEAEADAVQARDVALDARSPDLAQSALRPRRRPRPRRPRRSPTTAPRTSAPRPARAAAAPPAPSRALACGASSSRMPRAIGAVTPPRARLPDVAHPQLEEELVEQRFLGPVQAALGLAPSASRGSR